MNSSGIRKFLYSFILSSMTFYITATLISGIETSGEIIHWLMAFCLFAAANSLIKQTMKFFTLPQNFITHWVVGSILNFGAIYGMSLILPGIRVGETLIDPVSIGIISVNPYTLTPFLTIVLTAIVSSLFGAALYWLKRSE